MGVKLENPPLVEALCEFRFDAKASWDWTVPGQLYDRIRKEFPERSGVVSMEVSFKATEEPPATTFHSQPEKVQLKKPDGSALVQVGPHLLVINQLRPYVSWDRFRDLIRGVFEEHLGITGNLPIIRVGLRYINRLEIPPGSISVGSFLAVDPPLKGALDKPLAGFYQRYELVHTAPPGILIHQTGISRSGGKDSLMLDLDFVGTDVSNMTGSSQVHAYLDAAHDRIEEAFIGSLNSQFYAQLGRAPV